MVSVAASGIKSWVCDPNLVSYALEQPEMLRSHDYRHKYHAPFKCAPTVDRLGVKEYFQNFAFIKSVLLWNLCKFNLSLLSIEILIQDYLNVCI